MSELKINTFVVTDFKDRGLPLGEYAELFGVTKDAVSKWKRAETNPSIAAQLLMGLATQEIRKLKENLDNNKRKLKQVRFRDIESAFLYVITCPECKEYAELDDAKPGIVACSACGFDFEILKD